ncbi:MAG: hypothetical protein SGCHY_002559, partial [Lobulomycetales sp.]
MSAAKKVVALPLQLHGIDGRYASALYSAAVKSSTGSSVVKQAQADLAKVRAHLAKDERAHFVLTTPIFNKSVKQARISSLLSSVSPPVSPVVGNLLSLLAENSRL